MNEHDLDTLAALVGQMTPGPWVSGIDSRPNHLTIVGQNGCPVAYDVFTGRNTNGIVALVNAANDLIELARKGLEPPAAGGERGCLTCLHGQDGGIAPWCAKWSAKIPSSSDVMCGDIKFCGAWTPRGETEGKA